MTPGSSGKKEKWPPVMWQHYYSASLCSVHTLMQRSSVDKPFRFQKAWDYQPKAPVTALLEFTWQNKWKCKSITWRKKQLCSLSEMHSFLCCSISSCSTTWQNSKIKIWKLYILFTLLPAINSQKQVLFLGLVL